MDNKFNKVFPSFDPFNKEFTPGHCLIDVFSNCFSFHTPSKQSDTNLKAHIQSLNNIALNSSLEPSVALVVSDTSIKNHVATSITYIHVHNKQVIKMIHSLVVMLELNGVSEVQYKEIMIIGNEQYQQE